MAYRATPSADSQSIEKMSKCKEIKRYLPATVAWLLLISTTTLFFVFLTGWYVSNYSIWIPIGEGIVTVVVVANFTLATFMDPGVIPKATRGEDDNDDLRAPLYKTVEVHGITVRMKWCVTCQFYRPPRCSHCSVCNNCIETFDHHCPWVNNCIGRRNYRFFFMFLLSLSIHMMSIFGLCFLYVYNHMEKISQAPSVVAISIMVIIALLFIPILGLTGFHIILVSRGRTTNEQVTGKYRGGYNPFSRGCCKNCWWTLCGPTYPSLDQAKKRTEMAAIRYVAQKGHQSSNQGDGGLPLSPGGNQVNVYVDNGNFSKKSLSGTLPSLHSPRDYRQMMPAPNRDVSDNDLGLQSSSQSQSRDCEPTPPIQRHGSKNNFFLPTNSHSDDVSMGPMRHHYPRSFINGSPHPNRQGQRPSDPGIGGVGGMGRSRSHTPDSLSSPGEMGAGSPTNNSSSCSMHQKIRAIGGVPTPFAVSSSASPITQRSNPPTPTQGSGLVQHHPAHTYHHQYRPPSHIMSHHPGMIPPTSAYYDTSTSSPSYIIPNGGEQRRILSEGELMQQHYMMEGGGGSGGQIRELASSPQRGVYLWKDNSPTSQSNYFHHSSNPTSPIQPSLLMNNGNNSNNGRHPPPYHVMPYNNTNNQGGNRGGGGGNLSPSSKKMVMYGGGVGGMPSSSTVPSSDRLSRRPMSFVRALEMTDSLELSNNSRLSRNNSTGTTTNDTGGGGGGGGDRSSIYDTNYEISV